MGYLNINETKIYYEIHGKGEPLAFLNGIFMSTSSFAQFIPIFSKKFKLLLHDFRGQWNSGKEGDAYSLELHSKDFVEILNKLEIEKINIVGISYGGEIALNFSTLFPERVKSLIIISSVSEIDNELKEKIERWIEGAKSKNSLTFINSWLKDVYSEDFLKKYENFLRKKLEESLNSFDYDASIKLMKSFLNLHENPLTPYLKNISVPTLVVAGEFDTLKPPKFSKIIAKNIPQSEFVIIGNSGHAITVERFEEIKTVILGFLEKISLNERSE
ncbi:MAG: alpha/beta hydrolase [Caldisericia bacterium]|nr:alpha/beta hydrolase [Caldisericia bacterium]